ncbi:hypothetical protein RLOatenuis_5740 [Rickettsiales bacterium]|nr:hypothetical protein RLOatenuis_5740 [Rickettsiales bacterium]
MKTAAILKVILLIFLIVIFILLIVKAAKKCRLIFTKKLNQKAHKRYLEEKAKILEKQRQNQLENVQYYGPQNMPEPEQIVGIAKPVGRWTEFVIKQKFAYLHALKQFLAQQDTSGDNRKGFWQIMIEAKSQAQGRHQGKSKGR